MLGIAVLILFAWAISERRAAFPLRTVAAGLALQLVLALLLLKLPPVREALLALNHVVAALQDATLAGSRFVFGYLAGGAAPFRIANPGSSFILALQALPLVLVISALSALLYHWRILPLLVRGVAVALSKTLGVGGAGGVSTAANVFVGMVEAPLLVRPYLKSISRADLFLIMTAGMATIAGTVMVLYATFLKDVVPDVIGHLLTASLLNAPAAIIMARLLVPPDGVPGDGVPGDGGLGDGGSEDGAMLLDSSYAGSIDAVTTGTLDGLKLLLNIVAMLIVVVALVSLVNAALGLLPDLGAAPLTLQRALGYVMAPVAWLIGIPWAEAGAAGALLGTKIVLNELIAYLEFARLPDGALAPHSRLIMTYALCGFANFGSLGIMIGGLGAMVPERRAEVVALGLKAILAGTLATCLTASMVGLL